MTDPGPRHLRILFVGPERHGSDSGGLARALRRAGHVVAQVDPELHAVSHVRGAPLRLAARLLRPLAVREVGRRIVDVGRVLQPEICLIFKGWLVPPFAIRRLQAIGAYCANFYPDVSFTVHGREIPRCLPLYDRVFTTKSFGMEDMRRKLGVTRSELIRHGFDPELHRPIPPSPGDLRSLGADCAFIGTWSDKKARHLRRVVERLPGVRLRVWGSQWAERIRGDDPLRPSVMGMALDGDMYPLGISCTKINLAVLSEQRPGSSAGDQVTARTFQVPAAGGFLLHERTEELRDCFEEGAEVACFAGEDELADQIARYLEDGAGRERIRRAGHARAHRDHSLDARAQRIVERCLEDAGVPGASTGAGGERRGRTPEAG